MRVRISFDALRLCLLVAAGVTSGYLWRAAFESSSPNERLAATPRVVVPAPAPPVVRIPSTRVTPRERTAAPQRSVRQVVSERSGPAPSAGPSRPVSSTPTPKPVTTTPQPSPPPQPTPTPTPTPSPTPAPSTPTTQTQSASPAPTTTSPPPQAVPAPSSPPPTGPSDEGSRPGWGKGDENHDHTGPGKKNP
jgi:hypothetical protein